MNKRLASTLAMLTMLSGGDVLPVHHDHSGEYRNNLKTNNKGLSAEEMGTAHKNKKSRRERKRK